jgi:hypothetical protein
MLHIDEKKVEYMRVQPFPTYHLFLCATPYVSDSLINSYLACMNRVNKTLKFCQAGKPIQKRNKQIPVGLLLASERPA